MYHTLMGARICPKCKSSNITLANGGFRNLIGMNELHECNDCGYKDYLFPETEELDGKDLAVLEDIKNENPNKPFNPETKISSKTKIITFALFWLGVPTLIIVIILVVIGLISLT